MEMKFLLVTLVVFASVFASAFTQTNTTTAPPDTTTTTTTAAPPAPPKTPVLFFNLTCLQVNMSVDFDITYEADFNATTKYNESVKINLSNYTKYTGQCNNLTNTLSITFNANWTLEFLYSLDKDTYQLKTVSLAYGVTADQFPNATASSLGLFNATGTDLAAFSASKGNAYKCYADTDIKLNSSVTVKISNYFAQPFLGGKNPDTGTAVECSADTVGTSKLVPIIVGSALAILVILVLVAYIIGRRKHRPGYQQV